MWKIVWQSVWRQLKLGSMVRYTSEPVATKQPVASFSKPLCPASQRRVAA